MSNRTFDMIKRLNDVKVAEGIEAAMALAKAEYGYDPQAGSRECLRDILERLYPEQPENTKNRRSL